MQSPPLAPQSRAHLVRCAGDWLRAHARAGADLRIDSRSVAAGDIFVALPGRQAHGLQYLDAALARGAAALLVDQEAWSTHGSASVAVPLLTVAGLAQALGWIAAEYYGDPTARLQTIGITGTNGKTTSCQWIAQLLTTCGQRCATIGTLGFGFPGALAADEMRLTTPDAANVQRLARKAIEGAARALALEVSSIGLDQHRLDGVTFGIALFTNLTRDHLDYHADMTSYGAAKRKLFDWASLTHCVLNLDDEFGRAVARDLAARGKCVFGFGTQTYPNDGLVLACHLRAHDIEHHAAGTRFRVVCERAGSAAPVAEMASIDARVIGDFNVPNLLGVLGVALACGVPLDTAGAAAAALHAPAGRLQRVNTEADAHEPADGNLPVAVVDYAHSPDAISKALRALRPLARARGGRLWIVFGAGGDRDRGKRPVMAAAAAADADVIVLTSDNPRSEDADAIIEQLAAGIPVGVAFRRDADRERAIADSLQHAAAADVILIAGKGHEDYQEISGRRMPFSDVAVARTALLARRGRGS